MPQESTVPQDMRLSTDDLTDIDMDPDNPGHVMKELAGDEDYLSELGSQPEQVKFEASGRGRLDATHEQFDCLEKKDKECAADRIDWDSQRVKDGKCSIGDGKPECTWGHEIHAPDHMKNKPVVYFLDGLQVAPPSQ